MCRWLAYSGEPLAPSALIIDTPHSLVEQSLHSPLGKETVNGDGFGLGWYPTGRATGSGDRTDQGPVGVARPSLFRSIEPAWYDENLRELARAIESPLFFAHVRAASAPPIQKTNCHPFRYENWLFMHNGVIREFPRVRREILFAIAPELFPGVRGTTDSEALFHLALTFGLTEDPIGGMARAIRAAEAIGRAAGIEYPVQGSFAVADGRTVWAFRYSSEHRSRTLYHSEDMRTLQRTYPEVERLSRFGARARVIVSEPLSDLPGAYREVPESTVGVLEAGGYRQEPFLRD